MYLILVWYINKIATDGGGGVVVAEVEIPHLDTFFCTPSTTEEHVRFDTYELRIPSEN